MESEEKKIDYYQWSGIFILPIWDSRQEQFFERVHAHPEHFIFQQSFPAGSIIFNCADGEYFLTGSEKEMTGLIYNHAQNNCQGKGKKNDI